jgi:hypothetical protein
LGSSDVDAVADAGSSGVGADAVVDAGIGVDADIDAGPVPGRGR